jgi:H+-transporting ATPase
VPALPWYLIGWVWAYVFIWMFVKDWVKLGLYALIDYRARHHKLFMETVNQPLHS